MEIKMTDKINPKEYIQKYGEMVDVSRRIIECIELRVRPNGGAHALILPIDDSIISKIYFYDMDPLYAHHEKMIGKSLFSDGISVPEFYDLIQLPEISKKYRGLSQNVLLMERIQGDTLSDVAPELYGRALEKHHEELRKARNLGYSYLDGEIQTMRFIKKKQTKFS